MSMVEYKLAVDGYLESQGLKADGITWAEVEEIGEKYGIPEVTPSIRKKVKDGARDSNRKPGS